MIDLIILADDLTGALDTGIQFARYNIKTKILTTVEFSSSLFYEIDTEVLIVDTKTRHLSPDMAYMIIYRLVKMSVEAGVKYIYKKTDSGLRGNVGSELAAALAASNERFLAFIPALPVMNRVTKQGIQYIDGIPVSESVFGSDPYEPVKSSYVMDLFTEIAYNTVLYKLGSNYCSDFTEPTIGVFDAQTNEDLRGIGRYLNQKNQLKVIAGCTGFAAILPEIIGIKRIDAESPKIKKPLLVICGSMNPISRQQIEHGEEMGFGRITLSPEQLFEEEVFFSSEDGERWMDGIIQELLEKQVVMIDTGISRPDIMVKYMSKNGIDLEEVRTKISRTLGTLLEKFYMMKNGPEATVMIIGGDTLRGFIEKINCNEINLVSEITLGTVLSLVNVYGRYVQIISKSGGFGTKELFVDIANMTHDT